MENQLQANNIHQNSIALNGKEIEIAKIIYHVNQLTSFPLSAIQIEDWTRTISELRPDQNLITLRAIINMMKIGSVEYNSRLGIQNIFLALKKYDKIKIGFRKQETRDSLCRYNGEPEYEDVFYFEDDEYPSDMTWLVDKERYESFHLPTTILDDEHLRQMVY